MLFLRDIVEPRPTTSNLDVPNSLDEVLRDTEDDPSVLFGSMLPHQGASSEDTTDIELPHEEDITQTRSSTPLSNISTQPQSTQPSSLSSHSPTQTHEAASTITRTTFQTKRQKRKSQTDAMLSRVDAQLQEEKLGRSEQFLLSLADDMDSVPVHLRGQCKVHLLEVLLHYQAGVIPTTLSPAVRAALRDAETN
ncbi:uncharacterized protein LOC142571711 [Dermacentor variabilis]|uniref:uncharacterized protein LOC142571711 n=1 Tax=Dermacentor variabilis TaxID=34621 RepID=UPI003F5B1DB8